MAGSHHEVCLLCVVATLVGIGDLSTCGAAFKSQM